MPTPASLKRIIPIVLCCFLVECAGYDIADPSEVDSLTKLRSGEYELIKKDELAQLKKDADLGRIVGRYQTFSRSFRTWRLDTSTGANCIMLTTEEDWKNPETSAQTCH